MKLMMLLNEVTLLIQLNLKLKMTINKIFGASESISNTHTKKKDGLILFYIFHYDSFILFVIM